MQTFDSLGTKYIDFIPIPSVPKHGIYGDEAGNICVAINGVKVATLNIPSGGGSTVTAVNVVALQALGATLPAVVILLGFFSAEDGGGGVFVWNSASTAAVDGGTIIAVTGVAVGRYIRLFSGPLTAAMFGAIPGLGLSSTVMTTALQNAVTAASGKTLYVGPGLYPMKVTNQHAISIAGNNTTIDLDLNAIIQLETTATFTAPWGVDIDHVVGVFSIAGIGCTVKGGTFDWNTTNSTLNQYAAQIYTDATATNTHINGCRLQHSASTGIWNVNSSLWWCEYTYHTGGTAQDILLTRNTQMTHCYANNNYINSSTPGTGTQGSINFTGGDGHSLSHWAIDNNRIDAGALGSENPNTHYQAIQVFGTNNADPTVNSWINGSCSGNVINGVATPGAGGVAECISLVQVTQTVCNGNSCYDCYIGIEYIGFYGECCGNSIDGLGDLFAGIFMDGWGRGVAVTGNFVRGFGGWNPSGGITSYHTECTYTGNLIINEFGSGGSAFALNVKQTDATKLPPDGTTITGNRVICGGPGSIGIVLNDCSNCLVEGNNVLMDAGAFSAYAYNGSGAVQHLTRSNVVFKNNMAVGGPDPAFVIVPGPDIGVNFYCQATMRTNAAVAVNVQAGAAYTLALTDAGGMRLKFTNAGAVTLTIPTNATLPGIPIGTEIEIEQNGTGIVTPTAAGGVTLQGTGTHTSAQFAVALLTKTATNTWSLSGQIA